MNSTWCRRLLSVDRRLLVGCLSAACRLLVGCSSAVWSEAVLLTIKQFSEEAKLRPSKRVIQLTGFDSVPLGFEVRVLMFIHWVSIPKVQGRSKFSSSLKRPLVTRKALCEMRVCSRNWTITTSRSSSSSLDRLICFRSSFLLQFRWCSDEVDWTK